MPGTLELLPHEQIEFQAMADAIRRGFELFGYLPISTPAMELTDVLLTKSGGETERQVYLAQSSGARSQRTEPDLALRFDLTVPLARYVAEHEGQLSFPFRRYQIQPVWRGETPQRGRFREFVQCDIDVIDRDSLSIRYDAEIPAVIAAIFTKLDIGAFTIRINNRRLLRGLLLELGVEDNSGQANVLRELDKLERDGPEAVARALAAAGMAPSNAERLLSWAGSGAVKGDEAAKLLASLPETNPLLIQGKEELSEVFAMVGRQEVDPSLFAIDLSIARGLDYYTGTVYETALDGHPELGSVCSGGRYDDLASLYTKSRLPGVGISIGLTRLFWQLREAALIGSTRRTKRVVITLMDELGLESAMAMSARLRRADIDVEVLLETHKLARQLRYADRTGAALVIIAGEDERKRGTAQIRILSTQEQEEVPLDRLVEAISEKLQS